MGLDFDRADLRGFRAARARRRVERLALEVGLGADLEAFGHRGVGGHPLGQGENDLPDADWAQPFDRGEAFVFDVEREVEAGRAVRPPWRSAWRRSRD